MQKETNQNETQPQQKPKKSKIGVIVLIIILVLIAILSVAGYFSFRFYKEYKKEEQKLEETVSKPEVSEKLYANETLGFEVKYPDNFEVEENITEKVVTFSDKEDPEEKFTISVLTSDMEGQIKETLEVEKEEKIKIANLSGVKLFGEDVETGDNIIIYYVKKGNRLYHFSFQVSSEVAEKIVNSFVLKEAVISGETYKNELYGYSLEYPSDFELRIIIPNEEVNFEDPQNPEVAIGLSTRKLEKEMTIDEWLKSQTWPDKEPIETQFKKNDKISGIDVREQAKTGTIYFIHDKVLFMIENGIGRERKIVPEEIFDHFLSSFKFIETGLPEEKESAYELEIENLIKKYIEAKGDTEKLKEIVTVDYANWLSKTPYGHGGVILSYSKITTTKDPDKTYRSVAKVKIGAEDGSESEEEVIFIIKEENGKLKIQDDNWIRHYEEEI